MNSIDPKGELSRLILEKGFASADAQRLVREFFENLNVPMLVIDRELKVLAFTGALGRLFQLKSDSVGRGIGELHSHFPVTTWEAELRKVVSEEAIYEHEIQDATDSTSYLLRATPYRAGGGISLGALLLFSDVTEMKKAWALQERYAAIVESSEDAVIAKDVSGVVTDWNKGAERLFGYTAAEMIGRKVTCLAPPDLPEESSRILDRILKGEKVNHFETVRLCKDGRRIYVSLTVSPIRDANGRIIGASKIARDISNKKEIEEALKHGLRLRDDFISIASHELKTPLTSMKLQTQITKRSIQKGDAKAFSPENVTRLVDQTERQVDRLNRLVEDMLDISRISSGRLTLQLEEMSLAEAAHEVVANLAGFIHATDCVLTEDLAATASSKW